MKLNYALILLSAAGIAFTACSDNDDKTGGGDASTVSFSASAPLASRSATTTATLKGFNVWAYTAGKPYMNDVSVTRMGDTWAYHPVMFWPADNQPVDFYAITPRIGTEYNDRTGGFDIPKFVNKDGATDLLYSVATGATAGVSGRVHLNFRHALAQVAFNFKRREATSQQNALRVEVTGVELTDISSEGSFNFPRVTTAQNSDSKGEWSNVGVPVNPVIYAGNTTVLTDKYTNLNSTGYAFAVPQDLAESRNTGNVYTGAYLRVMCSVYDEESGVKLWPSTTTPGYDAATGNAYIYFPLNDPAHDTDVDDWEAGRYYVYNITIGVPRGTGVIDFDITVDEYKEFNSELE